MTFVLILPLLIIAVLAAEKYVHQRWIGRIPLRISVNGTRGKSSVVRYIVAGLRAAGHRPLGKITGISPVCLLPDGSMEPIRRFGKPRVQEQLSIVRKATQIKADCLVAECMAVNPELQKIDSRIVAPQIYVITNILDDHREVFGGDLSEYATAVCEAVPRGAKVVVADHDPAPVIMDLLARRGCEVTKPDELNDMELPFGVFPANLELAVKVCEMAGVDRAVALKGILAEYADTGINVCTTIGQLRLVNGLAVNDTITARHFLDHWRANGEQENILLHTRNDRPLRTLQFARWIGRLRGINEIYISGSHTWPARQELRKCGVPNKKIQVWDRAQVPLDWQQAPTAVYSFGNTGAGGLETWNEIITRTGVS